MKSLLHSAGYWVLVLVVSLVAFRPAIAQTNVYDVYYSDEELWKLGFSAYKNNDFPAAALYLYAYGQRHPGIWENPDTKAKFDFIEVIKYVTKNLVAAAEVKGDDPFGSDYKALTAAFYDNKPSPSLSMIKSEDTPSGNRGAGPVSNAVSFGVGVNDYPDHRDPNKSRNIENAYVNMYTVQLNAAGTAFEMKGVEIKSTGAGANPGATFWIQPMQMVCFEGFKTWEDAVRGAIKKKNARWTSPPPYKNFARGTNSLCQINFLRVNEPLQNDWNYACATSLSTPYQGRIIAKVDTRSRMKVKG